MSVRSNPRSEASFATARSEASFATTDLSAALHKAKLDHRESLNAEERNIGLQQVQAVNSMVHSIQERLKKIGSEKANISKQLYKLKHRVDEMEAALHELETEECALQVQFDGLPEQYEKACKIYNGKTPVVNVTNLSSAPSSSTSSAGERDFANMEAGTKFSNSRSRCAYRTPAAAGLSFAEMMSQGKASSVADDDAESVRSGISGISTQSRQSRTSTTAFSQQAAAWSHLGL